MPPEFRAAGGAVAQDSPLGEKQRGPGYGALVALLGRMNDDQIEVLMRIASVLDRQSMNACEALADAQMKRFKAAPANRGQVCQVGLWRFSRHPNYFFEALIWVGFALFALGSPHGWIALSCPVLMLYFLLKVTGIPLTEEYAVKSKGAAYREYQRTTSAFIPWFHKSL